MVSRMPHSHSCITDMDGLHVLVRLRHCALSVSGLRSIDYTVISGLVDYNHSMTMARASPETFSGKLKGLRLVPFESLKFMPRLHQSTHHLNIYIAKFPGGPCPRTPLAERGFATLDTPPG